MYKARSTSSNATHKATFSGHGETRIRSKRAASEEAADRAYLQGRSIFEALFGDDDDE